MLPESLLPEVAPVDVAHKIAHIIRQRTGNSVQSLEVSVSDDFIILNGLTSTFYNKQLATHAAQSAAKGRLLSNEIQVR